MVAAAKSTEESLAPATKRARPPIAKRLNKRLNLALLVKWCARA